MRPTKALFLGMGLIGLLGLAPSQAVGASSQKPRLVVFIGVDISGSFLKGEYFDDSMDFLAHYIYSHLNGLGDLEVPHSLFVGSIGGKRPDEPKTMFPIQTFENLSVKEIHAKLAEIFPKQKPNSFTDFNAFFEQIAHTVKNKSLVLKPINIVMISDGVPDVKGKKGRDAMRTMRVKPLETLSRNVTLRLLYTDAVTGASWQNDVPRRKVKIWTQDAKVMTEWRNSNLMQPGKALAKQDRLFSWVKDNVDFPVRAKRVD